MWLPILEPVAESYLRRRDRPGHDSDATMPTAPFMSAAERSPRKTRSSSSGARTATSTRAAADLQTAPAQVEMRGGALHHDAIDCTCDKCGSAKHRTDKCPHYQRPRLNDADAVQPSAARVAQLRAEGKAAPIIIEATVKRMCGSGLNCFFLTILAGLAWLGFGAVPNSVAELRRRLSSFLKSKDAATTVISQSGETLALAAAREGGTLEQMASYVLQSGTVRGLGGSELAAAVSSIFMVNVFTYQRHGKRFKLSVGSALRKVGR